MRPTEQCARRIRCLAWPSLSPMTRGTRQRAGGGRAVVAVAEEVVAEEVVAEVVVVEVVAAAVVAAVVAVAPRPGRVSSQKGQYRRSPSCRTRPR